MKKLLIILGVVGVSFSAIFVRWSTAPSMVLVFYRVAIATLLLLPVVLVKFRGELRRLNKKQLGLSLLAGLFLGLHFTAYFESLKYTNIASAVVFVDTEVFFVALAMLFLFHERIGWKAWIGILLAFLGSAAIALADAGSGSNILLGDGLALLGALFMCVYTLLGRVCRRDVSTTVYTFLVYAAAAVTVCLMLLCTGTPIFGYEPVNYATALGLAVVCTILGHSVFSWGLKYVEASYVANAKLLESVFATLLGVLIFGEVPGLPVILGGAVVILGVFVYSRFQKEPGSGQAQAADGGGHAAE